MSTPTINAVKRTFGYPMRDKQARTAMLIAAALILASMLIPVLPAIILAGYCARIMRPLLHGDSDEPAMPAWDNLSGLLRDGIRVWGARAIWTLPGIAMIVTGYALYMGTAIGYPLIADYGELFHEGLFWAGMGGGMALLFGGIIVSMIMSALQLVALTHVAETGRFGAAFAFRELWGMLRSDWGGWGLIMVLKLGLQSAVQGIATLVAYTLVCCATAPFIGAALSAWMWLVLAGLCAAVGRQAAPEPTGE